ncbi:MAG: hypothetical protein M5U28_37545 [Sandaracinaceae bacterium]|nr:hypothetical protein [Sandaracinaceae bacterium]
MGSASPRTQPRPMVPAAQLLAVMPGKREVSPVAQSHAACAYGSLTGAQSAVSVSSAAVTATASPVLRASIVIPRQMPGRNPEVGHTSNWPTPSHTSGMAAATPGMMCDVSA